MLDLERKLAQIEARRRAYRIALNRSRLKEDIDRSIWRHAADLTGRLDIQADVKETDPILRQACRGAFEAFETVRTSPTKEPITLEKIMGWHEQLLRYSNPYVCGHFRDVRAHWLNSTMILANWQKIPYLMDRLIDGINTHQIPAFYWDEYPDKQFQKVARHPVAQAIESNYNTVAIHPFQDGNKRVARLVSAWILKRSGYVPLTIYDREDYITGIETYHNTRRPHRLYEFLLDQMGKSYDIAMREVRVMDTIWSVANKPAARKRLRSGFRHSR